MLHPLRTPVLILVAALAATPCLPGQESPAEADHPLHQGAPVPEGYVAVVDGTPITKEAFIEEMARRYARPGEPGEELLRDLRDEAVVLSELDSRGMSVTDEEVEALWDDLDRRSRAQADKPLKQVLEENSVPLGMFRSKLRTLAGLRKLARQDIKLDKVRKLTNEHLNMWLNDHRDRAEVVDDPSALPDGVIVRVNGLDIPRRRFVERLLDKVDPEDIRRRVIEPLLQEVVAMRMLKQNGLTLTEADLMREYLDRKQAFEEDPTHKGLDFNQLVSQQTGMSPEEFRSTRGFRIRAAINLIGRKVITPAQLEDGYERLEGYYGPRLTVRHILIKASDRESLQRAVPSFEEAHKLAVRVRRELEEGSTFQDLARTYSEDMLTRFKGGLLPTFTPRDNQLDPAFVEAALELQPSQISQPVRTRSGWHVIRLEEREPAPPLAEVEKDLRRRLARELFLEAYGKAEKGVDVTL